MSSVSSLRSRYSPKYTEICVGNIDSHTEPNRILDYFRRYGSIVQSNFTSNTGGYLFITYEQPSMVDECIGCRPHRFDGRILYVKRALPVDDEHPRERFETTRDLMVVLNLNDPKWQDQNFLAELEQYFSTYGRTYACKFCQEKAFKYILVEFADKDHVDRVILDKPHFYYGTELQVMKYIESNVDLMNQRYAYKDAIDQDDDKSSFNSSSQKKDTYSEVEHEKEVYRLQETLKRMSEDFAQQRKQLEDDCCEQLKQLNVTIEKNQQVKQDLEKEIVDLTTKYNVLKTENELLNEQYLNVELENFEITSYYEQILAEEKAKTYQLENEYTKKLELLHNNSPKKSQST